MCVDELRELSDDAHPRGLWLLRDGYGMLDFHSWFSAMCECSYCELGEVKLGWSVLVFK